MCCHRLQKPFLLFSWTGFSLINSTAKYILKYILVFMYPTRYGINLDLHVEICIKYWRKVGITTAFALLSALVFYSSKIHVSTPYVIIGQTAALYSLIASFLYSMSEFRNCSLSICASVYLSAILIFTSDRWLSSSDCKIESKYLSKLKLEMKLRLLCCIL